VSFADTSEALLDLMNVMFRLENNVRMQAFSIKNFFSAYRTFFKMTLPYEASFFFGRTKLFEKVQKEAVSAGVSETNVALVGGPMIGAVTQLILNPLLRHNLIN
jgi:hypothetical protein